MYRLGCLLLGYLFGLIQTGYLIGKIRHKDIRQYGSGNTGATNTLRTFGKKAGALALLGDCLKCVLAMSAAVMLFRNVGGAEPGLVQLYAAAGCILGHNFPFYMNFKGGKGVAASLGFVAAYDWHLVIPILLAFVLVVAVTRYVSLGSLTAYTVGITLAVIFTIRGNYGMNTAGRVESCILFVLLLCLAFWQHRENIQRLKNGTENKLGQKKGG
ncbi:MAG: glycerol-3-phosphate 1-O-acyltransferase PlsY [Blautia sp.]|nr:glycerol-3-phosphate 1-O-acyltransferase PlsY [Blautia sp.]